jgi:hypothetical protein
MTEEEIHDAIRKLREFATVQEMQWVLDEVDEAIALGVPETRTLRQTTNRQGLTTYEDITEPDALPLLERRRGRRTGRSSDFIRRRPMTPQEQAQLLVQAFNRVLADIDAVAAGSLEALDPTTLSDYIDPDSETSFPIPQVGSISFVPDEGSTAPAISIDVIRASQRRAEVASILSEIDAEIDS